MGIVWDQKFMQILLNGINLLNEYYSALLDRFRFLNSLNICRENYKIF